MIRLGELVAAILNEMAIARTKATLFGAQMVLDFRDHELLRDLPIPLFGITGAELDIPFTVAQVVSGRRAAGLLPMDPSDLATAAKNVTEALPEQHELKEGFSLYDNQREYWRREVVPAIGERFATNAAEAMSIDAVSTIYGYLVKYRYLLALLERKANARSVRVRQSFKAGYPDLLGDTASKLMRRELERRLAERAEEDRAAPDREEEGEKEKEERKRLSPLVPRDIDSAVFVNVEAKELKDSQHVSLLKLQLHEGTLHGMTFSESEGTGRE
jgi:hypothetical protein